MNTQLLFFVNVKLYVKLKLKKSHFVVACFLSVVTPMKVTFNRYASSNFHYALYQPLPCFWLNIVLHSFILEFMYSCRKKFNKASGRPLQCPCQLSTFFHEPSLIIFVQVFHNLSANTWRYSVTLYPQSSSFCQRHIL